MLEVACKFLGIQLVQGMVEATHEGQPRRAWGFRHRARFRQSFLIFPEVK